MGGVWQHNFVKKTFGLFRFVNLPMKIPEMKLHPRKLHKIVTPHWNFQGQKTKEISSRFFYHSWKFHFFFHWPMTSGISTFYFFNNPARKHHVLNSPSCGCMHFFWNIAQCLMDSSSKPPTTLPYYMMANIC